MTRRLHPDVVKLLEEIDAYRARHGISRTRFGILVANDGHFLPRLMSGRLPRLTTIDEVHTFMRNREKC